MCIQLFGMPDKYAYVYSDSAYCLPIYKNGQKDVKELKSIKAVVFAIAYVILTHVDNRFR